MIEISLKSSDILYLSVSLFEVPNAQATIIIVPGVNEYKARYNDLINYLLGSGFNCLIYDPRGQGKSINDKNPIGYISSPSSLVMDLKIIVDYTKTRIPDLPIYVIADSLGALSALMYLDNNDTVTKFALVSPLVASATIETNLKMTKFLMNILGKNKDSQVISSILGFSKDQIILQSANELNALKSDPNCYYNYTNISIYNILELQKKLKHNKTPLNNNIKILFQTGMLDTNLSGKNKVLSLAQDLNKRGLTNISYLEYPNFGHKILFENSKKLVFQDILGFFLS